jgi:hypothetical protein
MKKLHPSLLSLVFIASFLFSSVVFAEIHDRQENLRYPEAAEFGLNGSWYLGSHCSFDSTPEAACLKVVEAAMWICDAFRGTLESFLAGESIYPGRQGSWSVYPGIDPGGLYPPREKSLGYYCCVEFACRLWA